METKLLIINIATTPFWGKGYIVVGINEILKRIKLARVSFTRHFPRGKEEEF